MIINVPSSRKDIMVLPEVVGGAIPEATVVELVALGDIVAILVYQEITVFVIDEVFVERVVLSQAHIPEVGVGLDARVDAVGTIHEAHVVIASCHAVPSLTGHLEVANVLVAELEIVINICDATVIASAAAFGTMDETIGAGLMVGSVDDEMIPEKSCGSFGAEVKRIE